MTPRTQWHAAQPAAPVPQVTALRDRGTVVGVDAGGSGTRAALVIGGVVTQTLESGPFNYLLQAGGVEQMAAIIRSAAPAAAGIGVPGIARQPGAAQSFARAVGDASGVRTRVASDATVAWLGAFLGGPGIAVVAGTGSVAIGGERGELTRRGGHGYLVGDQGGGYWIGRRALQAALAAAEGTGPATRLRDAVQAAAGATLDELVVRVHGEPRDRTILARLAPVVASCAEGPHGDPVARDIIAAGAGALAALAGALRQRLGELPVAGVGRVFAIPQLWAEFRRLTGAVAPLAIPEVGAALLTTGQEER